MREHVRISHESKQNLQKLLSSDPEDMALTADEGNPETTTTTQPEQPQEQQHEITKVIYLENIS